MKGCCNLVNGQYYEQIGSLDSHTLHNERKDLDPSVFKSFGCALSTIADKPIRLFHARVIEIDQSNHSILTHVTTTP